MKKYSLFGLTLLLTFTLLAGPRSADAKTPAALKPLKILVSAVRFGKHKLALTYLADREQGKILVGKAWDKGTQAQRARFQKLFKVLFAKMALRKFQNQYQHLKSIVYSKPKFTHLRQARNTPGSSGDRYRRKPSDACPYRCAFLRHALANLVMQRLTTSQRADSTIFQMLVK